MANNSQYPGIQPPRPPVAPMGPPQTSYPSVPMQFRPTGPPRAPPQYMPLVSQQFLPVGRPLQHLPPHGMVPPPPPPPAAQSFSVPDGSRVAFSITYNTSATSQVHISAEASSQYQTTSSLNNILPTFPMLQPVEQTQTPDPPSIHVTSDVMKAVEKTPSDWIEHTSRNGKRYYHNKKTRLSCWEKPLDLMSPIERADASTDWKECISPDGRKYYYNKVTKQSKWKIPDELKIAREQVKIECKTKDQDLTKDLVNEHEPLIPSDKNSPFSHPHEPVSSPALAQSGTLVTAELASGPTEACSEEALPNPVATSLYNTEDVSVKDAENGTPVANLEEPEKSNVTNLEEKTVDQENQVYETKQEAKNAFKALLENANVASDWTWDQAMRVIINDRRYSALRSLSERKQTFNEFIGQKKKQEAEERRNKQKKAREEFKKMLEESKEITYSTKWSKAIAIFEEDDRFKAVERSKDREELFEDHIMELEKKEREEHKKNKKEYIEFLKSCDFLTASSQWRKVQDRLEADESCLRLEKLDRLEIFQEYIRDLEKDEEEQRKLRMEEIRKTERKNREEFRKLMEGHIASGMLTSKSHWREYCIKVKELPAYVAVSSNSTGATPKDLFEDVLEELEKQYIEDRDRIKESVKMRKVSMSSTWTLEEFKNAIAEDIISPTVSPVNLKLVFDELQERVREREEKEAKRRKRLGDDFYLSLSNSKEITSSSRWEDFKPHFESRQESWFTVEESFFKEIFEKHITELKKARDERKHREDKAKKSLDRRMEKSRREKDRSSKKDKRRKDDSDTGDSFSHDDNNNNRRSVRDNNSNNKEKKHRKRERSLDHEDDKDRSRDSYRHSLERKRVKQLEQQSSVEYESRHKRYKRDHNRRGEYEDQKEAEDGEVW